VVFEPSSRRWGAKTPLRGGKGEGACGGFRSGTPQGIALKLLNSASLGVWPRGGGDPAGGGGQRNPAQRRRAKARERRLQGHELGGCLSDEEL